MRGSGWLLPGLAFALWVAAVAWPLWAAARFMTGPTGSFEDVGYIPMRSPFDLLAETSAYAGGIAIGALLAGWAPGRVLRRALGRRAFVPIATLVLVPMCLPAYAVTYAWWQSWPADSALHAWAVARDAVPLLRRATLVLGLVCWSWPIVAWCVAATGGASREELLRVDGAGRLRRAAHAARADARGLALGAMLVFLLAFNNTTCFDLAQVFSYGNELRALDALGAPTQLVLLSSFPFLFIILTPLSFVWWPGPASSAGTPSTARSVLAPTVTGLVWAVSVLVPFALLAGAVLGEGRLGAFDDLYRGAAGRDAARALASALLATIVAVGLATAWRDHRRLVRGAAHVQAIGWLVFALVPGTAIGIALEAAYNTPATGAVYGGPVILVLAHLARFGIVAALLARWVAGREPPALADLRRIDGAGTLAGGIAAGGPALGALAAAAMALTFVLALGEVPVTAYVHPPGSDPLVMRLLNDMHYQRPQAVMIALLGLLLIALAMAGFCVVVAGRLAARPIGSARVGRVLVLALAVITIAGCGPADSGEGTPLRTRLVFGTNGTAFGQFSYPRCIASDAERAWVYVVDKTARVQRFALDGEPETMWRMPAKENGKPTGISIAPDGRVFVADTHYHRIIVYDPEGTELFRFGRYGEEPGEFIYPTCVAFGPEGRLYVSEYGGHDRIQVFSPAGEYLFEFGGFGPGPGEFDRPQSAVFNDTGTELFIADACNHRISVVDAEGRPLRTFGGPGTGPGELHYPYGIDFLPDGSLLVAEFGNNRVQRFSPDGQSLGLFGRLGAAEGELRYPWDVTVVDDTVFVLDSGNNRVQTIRIR